MRRPRRRSQRSDDVGLSEEFHLTGMRAPVLAHVLPPAKPKANVRPDEDALCSGEIEAHSATSNQRLCEGADLPRVRPGPCSARWHQEAPRFVTVVTRVEHLGRVLDSTEANADPAEARRGRLTCSCRHRRTSFPAGESVTPLVPSEAGDCLGYQAGGHRDQRRDDRGGSKLQLRFASSFFEPRASRRLGHTEGSLHLLQGLAAVQPLFIDQESAAEVVGLPLAVDIQRCARLKRAASESS
jgi:hypothetical protein